MSHLTSGVLLTAATAHRPIQIAPSVLPADFSRLGEAIESLDAAGVDRIHWEIFNARFGDRTRDRHKGNDKTRVKFVEPLSKNGR